MKVWRCGDLLCVRDSWAEWSTQTLTSCFTSGHHFQAHPALPSVTTRKSTQCPAPQSFSKQLLLVSLSGLWATEVPKFLLIKSISTDMEMISVLPYNFWRGEGLHFHGQPIGPLSHYGLLYLLLPMLHTDESLSFERRNEGIRKGCTYVNISSLLPLVEIRSMNESWWSLLKGPSVNQWCLQVNCQQVLEMQSSV